ncbi:MAG TPA: hypothetical protein VHW66_03900 [Stellaceae bacterium]|nr:hypothetical protein [Stellaceae bacterium]
MLSRLVIAAAALLLSGRAAPACDFASAPTDRWAIAHRGDSAWLVTPCGEPFYSLGVNVLDGGYPAREKDGKTYYSWQAFAPSLDSWSDKARGRLESWGFNSTGGWSLPPQQLKMPAIIDLELGRRAKFHWFDPFSPATAAEMVRVAWEAVAPYRGSPYRIGYFSDNEVGWWSGALFVFYSQKPAASATKQHWVALLRTHYNDDWNSFAADFVPPAGVDSWKGLLAATKATQMRPGGHGIAVVRDWTGLVAERYYELSEAAIKAADPGALYFGDRLPIYYDPVAVRAMAPHVDAIAANYNVDAGDGWVARYFFDGLRQLSDGKPVLISEWFFAANENRTGNKNNGHLMTVETQAQRAAGAAAATDNFAEIPEVLGSHWFQYYDHPKGGRPDGEDYDFGLVDVNDQPYEKLTAALTAANAKAADIHAKATIPAPETDPITIPHAQISIDARSLTDWPKPASLLPPLHPSPDAAEFGEIYLSWSDQGLALATIGQDYFDLDLLAYKGAFPLGDSYRVELGLDAGAGPRRFTLFFIPGHGDRADHQSMSTVLCAGPADDAIKHGCTEPPREPTGPRAVYFGADQPRITAEMLIPWSALGIPAPHPGATITADVAMTSWYAERWMSLSRHAPEPAMATPADWVKMRLGDGVTMTAPSKTDGPG